MIKASGTVLWKYIGDEIHVCLVHRKKYSDWSLPKGKPLSEESLIRCAYRETKEETGFELRLGPFLGEVEYHDGDQEKKVSFWSAQAVKAIGAFDESEIQEIDWMPISAALSRTTYQSDKDILLRFNETEVDTNFIILLRHAKAIDRLEWRRSDLDRPLSDHGISQSLTIAKNLICFGEFEIISSPAERCVSTVQPLGQKMNQIVQLDWSFGEHDRKDRFYEATSRIKKLMKTNDDYLICSHNPILPGILNELASKSIFHIAETKLRPADAWILHHISGDIISIDTLLVDI